MAIALSSSQVTLVLKANGAPTISLSCYVLILLSATIQHALGGRAWIDVPGQVC
jgi:hypothetical protein